MQKKEKFEWVKFILDCFLCFGILIISPFIYSYLIKSDDLRWFLYPIQWLIYPIQWFLYPIECLFNIDIHTIIDISEFIVGFFSLSAISFLIINIFYKIHKISLIFSYIIWVLFATYLYYILYYHFTK